MFKWDESYSVNVKEIDEQHKKIIDILNELIRAMKHGRSRETLGRIIERLIDYAKVHFKTEEKYFHKFGYPDSDEHEKEHQDFVKKVEEFKKKYDEGRAMLSYEILDFLTNWLKHHIKIIDKKYSRFFNDRGLY